MNGDNVAQFPPRPVPGNGGNGGSYDARLRVMEDAIREIRVDLKALDSRLRAVEGDIREIKTQLQHVATRAWILGGILAGMGVAAGIGVALARIFVS